MKNSSKINVKLSSKIVKKKKVQLVNLKVKLITLILLTFLIASHLKEQYINLYLFQTIFKINIPNMLRLLNILKHGGMRNNRNLNMHRISKSISNWKKFKRMVKRTKYSLFNHKIQEITLKNKRLWYLMNWIKKHKLLAMEAI